MVDISAPLSRDRVKGDPAGPVVPSSRRSGPWSRSGCAISIVHKGEASLLPKHASRSGTGDRPGPFASSAHVHKLYPCDALHRLDEGDLA